MAGELDPATGFVVDLKQLKDVMRAAKLWSVRSSPPESGDSGVPRARCRQTENIAVAPGNGWRRRFAGARLDRVRVYETPEMYAEYSAEKR